MIQNKQSPYVKKCKHKQNKNSSYKKVKGINQNYYEPYDKNRLPYPYCNYYIPENMIPPNLYR
jgi:hypothetical protein